MPPAIAFQLMSRMRTAASVLSATIWAMPPPMTPAPRTPASATSTRRGGDALLLRLFHQEEEADEVLRDVAADDQRHDVLDLARQAALDAGGHAVLHDVDGLRAAPGSGRASAPARPCAPC